MWYIVASSLVILTLTKYSMCSDSKPDIEPDIVYTVEAALTIPILTEDNELLQGSGSAFSENTDSNSIVGEETKLLTYTSTQRSAVPVLSSQRVPSTTYLPESPIPTRQRTESNSENHITSNFSPILKTTSSTRSNKTKTLSIPHTMKNNESKIEDAELTQTNSTCVTLTWTFSGKVKHFTVTIEKNTKIKVLKNKDSEQYTLSKCKIKPGKKINWKIKAIRYLNEGAIHVSGSCYTAPLQPTEFQYEDGKISWKKGISKVGYFEVFYKYNNNTINKTVNHTTYRLEEVIPGAIINISVSAIRYYKKDNMLKTSPYASFKVTIKPSSPLQLTSTPLNTSCLEVEWKSGVGCRDSYQLEINGTENDVIDINIPRSCQDKHYNYTICQLNPGQFYHLQLQSVSNNKSSDLVFRNTRTLSVPSPRNLTFDDNTITWETENSRADHYEVNYKSNNTIKHKIVNITRYPIQQVIPGENLNINVTTIRIISNGDRFRSPPTYLEVTIKPSSPLQLISTPLNTSCLEVEWKSGVGCRDSYQLEINGTENDVIDINIRRSCQDKHYNYTICQLNPGQFYHLQLQSVSNTSPSDPVDIIASTCPSVCILIVETVTSTSVILECQDDSLRTNLELLYILHINNMEYVSNSIKQHISDLEPATKYTITVIVQFNGCNSTSNEVLVIHTNDDIPGRISNVNVTNVTSSTVVVMWEKPVVHKGIVIKYEVIVVKSGTQADDVVFKTEIQASNNSSPDVSNRIFIKDQNTFSVVVKHLRPYTQYSVNVRAFTIAGSGTPTMKAFQTAEEKPGIIDLIQVEVYNGTTVSISWNLPINPNGKIIKYHLQLENDDKIVQNETTVAQNYIYKQLTPFTKYSVRIRTENSKGFSDFTNASEFMTSAEVPYTPEDVTIINKTSTSVYLMWKKINVFRGNTSYSIKVHDTIDGTSEIVICGHQVFQCRIGELNEFWRYKFFVTAINTAGISSSEPVEVWTEEDKPGRVMNFTTKPEMNVTKPRIIKIRWKPPALEDMNGNILHYKLIYQPFEISLNHHINPVNLPFNASQYNLHVIPEVNYEIKLAAVTSAGIGQFIVQTSSVKSGILPNPREIIPFTRHLSDYPVTDKTHQLAISIPLIFLCNSSYGRLTERGILASKENVRQADAFENSYYHHHSWHQSKASGKILSYRVTKLNWTPYCDPHSDQSKFVVGGDKTCEDSLSEYCNGYLSPDTEYRFRVFICTSAGCTYSKYSLPIKTDAEENNTTLILACVMAVAAIIILLLIVAFVLYRKSFRCISMLRKEDMNNSRSMELFTAGRNRPIKISNFDSHVTSHHNDSNLGFSDEYKVIKQLSPKYSNKAAEREACRIKNRYTNVLAFDHSRVKLLPVDDDEDYEYINANFLAGNNGKREYIAAQGPLPATLDDFWRMIWEHHVSVVVMLTQCTEKGRIKCEKYWPETNDPVYFGDLIVRMRSESILPEYVIRIIDIQMGTKTRTVKQFHFLRWPDFGCPEKTWLLLNLVTAVRAHVSNTPSGPMVVHCSAGVGRTGTFIAVDIMLQHILDFDEIDIFGLVLEMRENRSLMVQTENQYIYIHDCIRDALIDDTDEDQSIEHIYANEAVYENT